MRENAKMPVALFNGVIVTTNGIYSVSDIDVESAKEYLKQNGFISAIGHEATAQLLSEILGMQIPANRIELQQQVGQKAIALKLKHRAPEGKILNREQLEEIGFTLKLIERLE